MNTIITKLWTVTTTLLDAQQLVIDQMTSILYEMGDVTLQAAIRDLEAAPKAQNRENLERYLWSATNHLGEAYESFSRACDKSSFFPSQKVVTACQKAVSAALLAALCYRFFNEQHSVDQYTEFAAKAMGNYRYQSLRGNRETTTHHRSGQSITNYSGVARRKAVENQVKEVARIIGKLRSDNESFIIIDGMKWGF